MNIPFRHTLLSLVALASVLSSGAITPEEVNRAVAAARETPKNQNLNRKAGDALKDARRYWEAISYYLKGGNAGNLGAAESSFYFYE